MKKWKMLVLIAICLMLLSMECGCGKETEDILVSTSAQQEENSSGETPNSEHKKEKITVHVCGEVKNPGVYELDPDDRVISAVEAAGGFTKKAAAESVNQAQKMKDGQQIYIPSRTEQQKMSAEKDSKKLISINQATKEEFMTLPGIGEAKADSIVSYREQNGSFESTEDLMKISGIKEGVYNKIKDYITL